jgi:hypothetical protein
MHQNLWTGAEGSSLSAPGNMLAILCNPPMKPAGCTTTWRNVEALSAVMGASSFAIANLIEQPSRSTRDISALAGKVDLDALTLRLQTMAMSAELVVVGWGARAPAGWHGHQWQAVLNAATCGLVAGGHEWVAHVSETPRHPSRWRQHTSPFHERYNGATFELRLEAALRWSPVQAFAI